MILKTEFAVAAGGYSFFLMFMLQYQITIRKAGNTAGNPAGKLLQVIGKENNKFS